MPPTKRIRRDAADNPSSIISLVCPNPPCQRRFKVLRSFRSHLSQSTIGCGAFIVKQLATNATMRSAWEHNVDAAMMEQAKEIAQTDPAGESDISVVGIPQDATEAWAPESDQDSVHTDSVNTPETTADATDNQVFGAARFNIPFTTSQLSETMLLKLLQDTNAPHYLFQSIIEWAGKAKQMGYQFETHRRSRASQIRGLQSLLSLENHAVPQPETTHITMANDGPACPVTRFDFTTMLRSLLEDPSLTNDLSMLDVNPDDPFGKYVAPLGRVGSVNSGRWYETAYANRINDPTRELLVPICFACDETQLNGCGRAACWPLVFSTTLFGSTLRNLPNAWRPLGYIYDTSIQASKAQRGRNWTHEQKAKHLHQIFAYVLESYVSVQRTGGLKNVRLTLGSQTKVVDIKVPCVFIIGDIVGGDKLCGRIPSYNSRMNRLCRKCNVRGEDADDPTILCHKVQQRKVVGWVANNEVDRLAGACQYNVHSAWYDVDYGGCKYGIFSAACPTEGLHSLELGLIADCLRVLFQEDLKPAQCAMLDNMAKRIVATWPRQRGCSAGADSSMPRLLWSDGITNLAQMNAKYKVGMMFTVVIIALTTEGKAFFIDHFQGAERYRKMVYVFQLLLSYWMWLKRDMYWAQGDTASRDDAKRAIQVMLRELKELWPRMSGQAWKKAKFHEQLHVPDDIERNGAPKNYHTGPTEHHHIWHVKNLSRNTQRRRVVLDEQIAARASESYLIDLAYQRMTFPYDHVLPPAAPVSPPGISRQSSKFDVYFDVDDQGDTVPGSVRYHPPDMQWQASVRTWLTDDVLAKMRLVTEEPNRRLNPEDAHWLTICTEYTRGGEIFRAHGNYRSTGAWYDWAVFRWDKVAMTPAARSRINRSVLDSQVHYGDSRHAASRHDYSPGQILGFFEKGNKVYAIADCCGLTHMKNSVFTTEWKMEDHQTQDGIYVIDTDSIVRPALMIATDAGEGMYTEVWAKERWADEFLPP